MKILLDYVFPITTITPTPAASTAFLKQVCVVCKPKSGQEGNVGTIFQCSSMTAVAVRTDNENAEQCFDAGMSKVYILLANDLDISEFVGSGLGSDFYTVLVSDDFVDADFNGSSTHAVKASKTIGGLEFEAVQGGVAGNSITITLLADGTAGDEAIDVDGSDIIVHMEDGVSTAQNIADALQDSVAASALVNVEITSGQESVAQADAVETPLEDGANAIPGTGIDVGDWDGVIGVSSSDDVTAQEQAIVENRSSFFCSDTNGASNMCYAFGKLLSNAVNWLNQQYITMPFGDEVATLGDAETFFDEKVSFVMSDDEFSDRLALFAAGGKAIVAPYIIKNLSIDLQSAALTYISGNQPQYTKKEASLMETRLQEDVINSYIARGWITAGTILITLVNDNFVASGAINVSEPTALWRVVSEMRETL